MGYPVQPCADAEAAPQTLVINSEWRFEARGSAAANPHEGASWEDALDQVDKGWLDGPSPFDEEGRLTADPGPKKGNQTFSFGIQQGSKSGATAD